MGWYRKVTARLWNDGKFQSLSDDGKLVFLFLLVHPNMTVVGAMRATAVGLAAEMRWELNRFLAALGMLIENQMVTFDENAHYIELPNFLKYNRPNTPRQIVGWGHALDLLPDCECKGKLIDRLEHYAVSYGDAFASVFEKSCGAECPSSLVDDDGHDEVIMASSSPRNENTKLKAKTKAKRNRSVAENRQPSAWWVPFRDYISATWEEDRGCKAATAFTGVQHWVQLARMVRVAESDGRLTLGDLKRAWDAFLHSKDNFVRKQGLSYFAANVHVFLPVKEKNEAPYRVERKSCDICGGIGRILYIPAKGYSVPWLQHLLQSNENGVPCRCNCEAGEQFLDLPSIDDAKLMEASA